MSNRPVLEEGSGPLYLRLALDLDRSWIRGAACITIPQHRQKIWFADPDGRDARPADAREARAFCRACPSQWDCVQFAIDSHSVHCTWAVHAADRRLLADFDDWRERVEEARQGSMPVLDLVRTLRPPRRYEKHDE